MTTWIAFLRAVNIGKRAYPMAELRSALEEAGFTDVATHIQTGNVRLSSPERSRSALETAIERVLRADRGFDVTTMALTPQEVTRIARDVPILAGRSGPGFGHYVSVLKDKPLKSVASELEALSREGEHVVVRGRVVHLMYDVPYHLAKTSNAVLEKIAGPATNRNARVMTAVAAKWGA